MPLQLMAQRQVVIYRDGRSPMRFDLEAVDSICFEDALPEQHEVVDLGLNVLWAACNIGAEAPEGYGSYFAWGEVTPKEQYTEENYLYFNNAEGITLPQDISGTEYDAATVLWKGEWRMPTIADIEELTTQCTWTWTAENKVNGYRVTGPSGKSIFLPAAGQQRDVPINVGSTGYYWSSTLSNEYTTAAYNLNFTGYTGRWSANRSYGFAIRPVCDR